MAETWRGIYPITSFVLEALGRKRKAVREVGLAESERVLLVAAEFWAAAAHGSLESYLQPDPLARLVEAQHAFGVLGAVRVVSLLRVAADSLGNSQASARSDVVIALLDDRLARTDDNIDDLIARYAGSIDEDPATAAALR
jgi:hypothetical protein